MAILTHGSDLSLCPTLAPVVHATDGTVRTAVTRLAQLGFQAIQLDATLSGIRPRELDSRARKDLLALLGRAGVRLGGVDLFLPRRHYAQAEHVDRAMAATLAAIELAADLGRVPLCLNLPVGEMTQDARASLVEAAEGRGLRLAVLTEGDAEALLDWVNRVDLPALGAAVDPALVIARGGDVMDTLRCVGRRATTARLDDAGAGERCAVGDGELDVVRYRVEIDLLPAGSRTGPVVLDLRGLPNPLSAAAVARTRWEGAAFTV